MSGQITGSILSSGGTIKGQATNAQPITGGVAASAAVSGNVVQDIALSGSVAHEAAVEGSVQHESSLSGNMAAAYGTPGVDGGYYIPSVEDGELTWEASKVGMPPVPSVHIVGKDGKDGIDGKDGYTPVKNKDYFDGLPGKDGQNGQPGKDGTSPVVSISAIEGGHRINITDTSGTKTVDVMNGSDGKNGSNGQDGNGIKSAILNDDYTLTLTFDDGTRYTTPSIRGATGEPGIPGQQGIQGVPGEPGQDGKSGVDGITPHIGDNGNWFIGDTDTGKPSRGSDGLPGKDGSDGSPGADGRTPEKGVDYFTAEDVQSIVTTAVSEVTAKLSGVVLFQGGINAGTGKVESTQDSITLSDSAANYGAFDIYYVSNDTHWSHTKVIDPNGKDVMLLGALVGNTDVFMKLKCIRISGKTVSIAYGTDSTKFFAGEGALIGGTLTRDKKFIVITKIVGYPK